MTSARSGFPPPLAAPEEEDAEHVRRSREARTGWPAAGRIDLVEDAGSAAATPPAEPPLARAEPHAVLLDALAAAMAWTCASTQRGPSEQAERNLADALLGRRLACASASHGCSFSRRSSSARCCKCSSLALCHTRFLSKNRAKAVSGSGWASGRCEGSPRELSELRALQQRRTSRSSRSTASRFSRRCRCLSSSRRCLHESCLSKSCFARSGVTAPAWGLRDDVLGWKVHSLTSRRCSPSRCSCSRIRLRCIQTSLRAWTEAGPPAAASTLRLRGVLGSPERAR
mmetsp:Transcript_55342/g.172053  ORF Transcript_55342/g.172053 Transcript_55342/m.172053 type:complete len:285 (-) Transcript_55342:764-1618(-)